MRDCATSFVPAVALFASVVFSSVVLGVEEPVTPTGEILDTLHEPHPRLFLNDEDLARLRGRVEADSALRVLWEHVQAGADACLKLSPLTYDKRGPRLLHVSRECLRRVRYLALAWRLTGRQEYARAAADNLLTVCAFKDWNPSHFLDTAEMSHAVGLGYDWLHSWMDEETRETVRSGLIERGLEPGVKAYGKGLKWLRHAKEMWWVRSEHNWNQVCNGGLVIGALAVAESDPQYARTIIRGALDSLPRALESYDPDGGWPEGVGYWHYATEYTVYCMAALDSALGTDFGLSQRESLAATGRFPLYMAGPTGEYVSFADVHAGMRRTPCACMFWLARRYGDDLLAASEHAVLAEAPQRVEPLHLVWYESSSGGGNPPLELNKLFRGSVPVAVFRSAWDDPEALFVSVKAGYNQVNHGHLDLGSFELDALGVRWARDLGGDYYNLPGYWAGGPGGARWTYYRLNSHSHNVPLIDDADQDPLGVAEVVRFEPGGESPFVVIDLSRAYGSEATAVRRGVRMVADRCVLVQDEFELRKPSEVKWGMTTKADIAIGGGNNALLTQDGKKLKATILDPVDASFAVESAEQEPPQARNESIRRLVLRVPAETGNLRIAVLFEPGWDEGSSVRTVSVCPLGEW